MQNDWKLQLFFLLFSMIINLVDWTYSYGKRVEGQTQLTFLKTLGSQRSLQLVHQSSVHSRIVWSFIEHLTRQCHHIWNCDDSYCWGIEGNGPRTSWTFGHWAWPVLEAEISQRETNKHGSNWSPNATCSKASSSVGSCQVKRRRWTCFLHRSHCKSIGSKLWHGFDLLWLLGPFLGLVHLLRWTFGSKCQTPLDCRPSHCHYGNFILWWRNLTLLNLVTGFHTQLVIFVKERLLDHQSRSCRVFSRGRANIFLGLVAALEIWTDSCNNMLMQQALWNHEERIGRLQSKMTSIYRDVSG